MHNLKKKKLLYKGTSKIINLKKQDYFVEVTFCYKGCDLIYSLCH